MITLSVELVVAVANYGAIGHSGDLVWKNKKDLARFKALTTGHPVIMGRKTWESLPKKPLPNRVNVVVSSTMDAPTGAVVARNLDEALDVIKGYEKAFVIGGALLYAEAEKLCSKIHLTRVFSTFRADTFFPHVDYTKYKVELGESFVDENDVTATFYTYTKK
jgi:dihydrofolate reductase